MSQQVHRIGHHFINELVEAGCALFQYRGGYHDNPKSTKARKTSKSAAKNKKQPDGHKPLSGMRNQETHHREVKEMIREIFPKIPESDLAMVVARAWEEVSQ